jgi:hypothetical protein
VVGGSGYSVFPSAILEATGADYGIAGDGEVAAGDEVARRRAGEEPRPAAQARLGAAFGEEDDHHRPAGLVEPRAPDPVDDRVGHTARCDRHLEGERECQLGVHRQLRDLKGRRIHVGLADASAELIVSIFFPRTPLHDGAVVIKGDIIEAAKCMLPLSDNPSIPASMGTRHRAALGLSEECDAAIIAVSEESGRISLAHGGTFLGRDYDEAALKEELQRLIFERSNPGEP